jgi:hypothetical protein
MLLYIIIATSLFINYSDHMLGCWSVVHYVSINVPGADVNVMESWLAIIGLSVHNCLFV